MISKTAQVREALRFRLSTVGLLFLVLAITLAVHRRYVAHQALAAICQDAEYIVPHHAARPQLQHFFDGSLSRVHHLSLHDRVTITDGEMAHVARLSNLRRLSLHRTSITDRSARAFSRLTQLETLSLYKTNVGNATMKAIGNLRRLRSLNLSHTNVTDDGFGHLSELPQLEELEVAGIEFSNQGLRHISRLRNLKKIRLACDCGFEWHTMPALQVLHVLSVRSSEDVTVRDLPELESLTIEIQNVPGQDAPVVSISRLPRLRQLVILGAGVELDAGPELRTFAVFGNRAMQKGKQPTIVVRSELPNLSRSQFDGVTVSSASQKFIAQ